MILVDTNIIIKYWKDPDSRITEVLEKEDIAICGIVKAELIHGARSESDIEKIITAISCFDFLQYSNNWDKLGQMLYKLRVSGYTLPITDVIIAQIAIEHDVDVFSDDKHFEMIKNIFPNLSIYSV